MKQAPYKVYAWNKGWKLGKYYYLVPFNTVPGTPYRRILASTEDENSHVGLTAEFDSCDWVENVDSIEEFVEKYFVDLL